MGGGHQKREKRKNLGGDVASGWKKEGLQRAMETKREKNLGGERRGRRNGFGTEKNEKILVGALQGARKKDGL